MKLECGGWTMDFNVPNGVYSDWGEESGSGKTLTYTFLKTLVEYGNNDIFVATYYDVKEKGVQYIINNIKNNNYKLIFIDRGTLFVTEELMNVLYETDAIIFIDIKSASCIEDIAGNECYMSLEEGKVSYYVDIV